MLSGSRCTRRLKTKGQRSRILRSVALESTSSLPYEPSPPRCDLNCSARSACSVSSAARRLLEVEPPPELEPSRWHDDERVEPVVGSGRRIRRVHRRHGRAVQDVEDVHVSL